MNYPLDYYITVQLAKQGKIPVFSMEDETVAAWNAKAKRVNRECALRRFWVGVQFGDWRDDLTADEAELVMAWDEQAEIAG